MSELGRRTHGWDKIIKSGGESDFAKAAAALVKKDFKPIEGADEIMIYRLPRGKYLVVHLQNPDRNTLRVLGVTKH